MMSKDVNESGGSGCVLTYEKNKDFENNLKRNHPTANLFKTNLL